MSEHTPGPWTMTDDGSPFIYYLNDEGINRFSASVQQGWASANDGQRTPHSEILANAHLIAAAPDLLAALKEIVMGIGPFHQDPLEHAGNVIESMQAIARAAIAKAEGGAA